jgi:hypothetical protein
MNQALYAHMNNKRKMKKKKKEKQAFYCLSHTSSLFFLVILQVVGGVSQTICLGWPQSSILLTLASQLASITCLSHWHLASFFSYICINYHQSFVCPPLTTLLFLFSAFSFLFTLVSKQTY